MELIFIFSALIISVLVGLVVKHRGAIEFAAVGASFVAFLGSCSIALKVAVSGSYSLVSFFEVDSFGAIVLMIIGLIGFATAVYSVTYLRQETKKQIIGFGRVKQYFILLDLFLAAMFLATTAASPVFTWIAIEATTLSTAFLISFYNKPSAIEGAWKYLIINSVGLLLAFFGTLLFFTSVNLLGENVLVSWHSLIIHAASLDPLVAKIAFIFILVGYGTKVGLAPMHTWLPDAHSKAPAPISALLSGVLLNVAFVAVIRFKAIADLSTGSDFSNKLLISFGLLSICVAAFIIIGQKNYKRLLAYSSIENMGIMALGFGFGGLGVYAAILHMIYHALIKSALFLSAGNIFLKYSSTKIINVRGVLYTLPVTSILFFAGVFAITGTPPFGVFLTKMFILSAGMKTYPVISIVVLFSLAVLFIGFFKHTIAMIFGGKPENIEKGEDSVWLVIPAIALLTVVIYLSFHLPMFLQALLKSAAS